MDERDADALRGTVSPDGKVTSFDFAAIPPRERYKLMIGTVLPRPIALVTTVSAAGLMNAAPYSFFNCLSADPAIVALGIEFRATGAQKDTGRNVRETQVFTVNIVSDAIAEQMNICAVPFEAGTDELKAARFTPMPGVKVASPWIGEAPAAFECRHHTTLVVGRSREIILGEVVYAHYRSDLVDRDKRYVDAAGLDAIGRMGGHGYTRTREYFDLPTISVPEWEEKGAAANRRTFRR